ncbi:MAG TPA: radical SAM protein [Polyangia bacterium]|nr:radical SAM protein [Polyangia bacterium]
MKVLLLTPPMVQVNTPYPATAYLTGFLRARASSRGVVAVQDDPAIALVLRLLSRAGLAEVRDELLARRRAARRARVAEPASVTSFLAEAERYLATVDATVRFLQGADPSLALRIAGRAFLPEGPRFATLKEGDDDGDETLAWAFGALGVVDRAKYLASLYVDDLADVVRDGVDARFELSRYGESLSASAPTFDDLAAALAAPPSLVDRWLDEIAADLVARHAPDLVALTVPFPGNVYGAFRIARAVKRARPGTVVALGGGYVNTELRGLADARVFDDVDFVTFDDGEAPLLALIDHLRDRRKPLLRTMLREGDRVVTRTDSSIPDVPPAETGTPTYDGLPLGRYLSLVEMLNPMHRLWSDGRWNKLTVAHGCYWKKCTFCDVTLDYIGRYDPVATDVLVDRIEALVAETGQTGFHFVDEAAPPAALRALAERLIARKVAITWWGNIRFEKTFTPALAELLARSGCVAVSGGLEVASDRLLALMEKGVTVAQVARVSRAFTDAGIMVHAYLMYGFPTETRQETIDALERVRQLFEEGCIQSAFWHRFAATAHSPIGQRPELFGIRLRKEPTTTFARNELPFDDPTGVDHEALGRGLRKAVYNFMHGIGLDADVRTWFDEPSRRPRGKARVPPPEVPRDLIRRALAG